MTAIGVIQNDAPEVSLDRRRGGLQQLLIISGIVAPALYLVTDILGGLRYPGYSFTSQAVSELMAIGAPSETVVDPLFLLYGLLALVFGIGVIREASERNRPLRVAGMLLTAYAGIGLTGPIFFEMHPRGASLGGDLPHIVLTMVIVVLTLLAMGFAAFALGRRFRVYSLITLAAVIALGAATAPYASQLEAGLPTPGFGILERVLIYGSQLWIAVFAFALLRRRASGLS